MAGGVPRYVPLTPQPDGNWHYDLEALEAAFAPRTKLLFLNTPHNPTGKVFTGDELGEIAALCQRHNVIVVADEVYERMTFGGHALPRIARLPGMWERTLSIGSAGKTFSATGWKVGWAIGPAALVAAVRAAYQWITFSVATPLQVAVAEAVSVAPALGYYDSMAHMYEDPARSFAGDSGGGRATAAEPGRYLFHHRRHVGL